MYCDKCGMCWELCKCDPIEDETEAIGMNEESKANNGEPEFNDLKRLLGRQYRNGFLAGWNAGVSGDEKTLKLVQNRPNT